MSKLPNDFVLRYARPPSESTVAQAKSLHQNVRTALGDGYATLLQGSYKNDTSLWDMNDVDLVAVSSGVVSNAFGRVTTGGASVSWDEIFARIERTLQADRRYAGKWQRKDKCIQLNTGVTIDIVPAIYVTNPESDPVAIYSFRERRERRNWPRNHYEAGAEKSRRTDGAFKQTVRLFKAWRRAVSTDSKIAPSFYIECLLHAVPDNCFSNVGADAFMSVGREIVSWNYQARPVLRPGGGDSIFTSVEWDAPQFKLFQQKLSNALGYVEDARRASNEQLAREAWIRAFNGQSPS
ncbi:MAG: nucleotidyltransferase [Myxococcales bacterium]|nr:nucleotidyltransferase [Myxococcales bacterium]